MGRVKGDVQISEDVIAGFTSAVITRTFLAPLDVLKIRFQLQTAGNARPKYSGIWSGARIMLQEEGLRALWKGNVAALVMSSLWTPLNFAVVRSVKNTLTEHGMTNTSVNATLAGGVASAAATSLTYPLDFLRTRFAVQGERKVYASYLDAVKQIYRQAGVIGFYTGLPTAVIGVVPYMALMFGMYDTINSGFVLVRAIIGRVDGHPPEQPAWEKFAVGFLTGIGAKTLTHPFTVIKTRLQTRDFHSGHLPTVRKVDVGGGFMGMATNILRVEGARGMFRGLAPALLKAGPSSALHFGVYETCIMMLQGRKIPEGRY